MKTMNVLLAVLALGLAPMVCSGASPAQEKQFVDTYKKAYEGKDAKTLQSLLYTKGADPQALEFYKMMMTSEMGGKIASIDLVDLSASDKADAGKAMPSPDGRAMKLVLPATKKLVIKSASKDKNGSSSSTSSIFVGESDGKLYVLVPGPAK